MMDTETKDVNICKVKPLASIDSPRVEELVNGNVDSESNALLPSGRGGISRKSDKTRRKVQWNDKNGNKLAEVLEFEPSDMSDFDGEDKDSCICVIM